MKLLYFFVGFFLSIKYSDQTSDFDESYALPWNRLSTKVNTSDLKYCAGCCDDLNDVELKQLIETRLDLNYFNSIEALKKRETEIYKDMKACLQLRPLITCADLCLCKSEACIYQHLNRGRILSKAFNCMKKELRIQPKWKNREITMSDLERNNLDFERCWISSNLNKEEVYSIKIYILSEMKSTKDEQSDRSYEQNSNELFKEKSNTPSPITTSNCPKLSSLLSRKEMIIGLILIAFFI